MTSMETPMEGITISVKVLSRPSICSKNSYNKNIPKREKAMIAYISFFRRVFLYAEIDIMTIATANIEPAT